MAQRFMDTNFYKSPYVRSLKGALKGLYSFIICDCTGAGIWAKDLPIASAYIGFEITDSEFDEWFVKKGKAVDLNDGKFFFPSFIEHQYPSGLQGNNKAHKNFIVELQKYDLLNPDLSLRQASCEGATKPQARIPSNGNGNGNSQGKGHKGKKDERGYEGASILSAPTLDAVKEYFKEHGYLESSAETAFRYYENLKWHDKNGEPVLNWKNKMNNVWFKEENKDKPFKAPNVR